MKPVKTVKGRMIDIQSLIKQHENTKAVSNIPMNANGDRLDSSGNVIATIQKISQEQHKHSEAPEMVNMSEIEETVKDKPKSKRTKKPKTQELLVVNESIKTRDDGSKYTEIEYDDGSMETKEISK